MAMAGNELEKVTIDTVKATAPVVAENANAITIKFYHLMFDAHPELRSIFNMSNHRPGKDGMPSAQVLRIKSLCILHNLNIKCQIKFCSSFTSNFISVTCACGLCNSLRI